VLANFPWPRATSEDNFQTRSLHIGGPCPWGGDIKDFEFIVPDIQKLKIRPFADIWIETFVDHIAHRSNTGSPAPLGPESGPSTATIL